MDTNLSKYQKELSEALKLKGYNHENIILLGCGSEGAIFSNGSYIFKYFFKGITALTHENLLFIRKNFVNNKQVSGVRLLSDIICDENTLIFVTPYEAYWNYTGGEADSIIKILIDSKINNYVFMNFHPKNLMYDKDKNLKIIDIGKSLVPYDDKKYKNMVCRAYLSTYFYERPDLMDMMSSIHTSQPPEELNGIDIFLNLLYNELETIR